MKRKKITEEVAATVIYKSDRMCCVCQNKRGVHIHHINADSSDNDLENLAFLCFDCHDDASKTNSLSRKLSPATIKTYRSDWYEIIELKRKAAKQVFNSPNAITTEDILVASKNALIIIDLVHVKERYYKATWSDRCDILESIEKYYPHTNHRLAYEVFSFCTEITEYNRGELSKEVACVILGLVMNFNPQVDSNEPEKSSLLLEECCRIGFNIVFDTAIYCKDYTVVMYGLTILKYAFKKASNHSFQTILSKVDAVYSELRGHFKGSQYVLYSELLDCFIADLKTNDLAFPPLSPRLMQAVYPSKS